MRYTQRSVMSPAGSNGSVTRGHRVSVLTSQVPPTNERRGTNTGCATVCRCASLTAAGFRGHGLAVGALNLLRADRVLHLYLAAGKPPILADRSTVERRRPFLDVQRHDADFVSSPDGQETLGLTAMEGKFSNEACRVLKTMTTCSPRWRASW